MGIDGNEVSMRLDGKRRFGQKYYWPFRVDTRKSNDFQEKGEKKVYSQGMTKARQKGASEPLILSGFLETWTTSVHNMSMYVSFAERMSDIFRVWKNTSSEIRYNFGTRFDSAVQNMLRDFNGGNSADDVGSAAANAAIRVFKRLAVAGKLSVVVQQPGAILRAAGAYVPMKYFAGTAALNPVEAVRLFQEAAEFVPVYWMKSNGSFDTASATSFAGRLREKQYKHGLKKVGAAVIGSRFWTKGAELADQYAWGVLYQAIVKETRDTTDLVEGSRAWKEHIRDRLTDVIRKSQVYDSVLTKPELLRSKSAWAKNLSAFANEPTKAASQVYEAVLDMRRGRGKEGAQKIVSVLSASLLSALAKNLIRAALDDEDYEKDEKTGKLRKRSYWDKFLDQLISWGTLLDVLPGFGLPLVRDVLSVAQGYDVERQDMSVIKDVVDTVGDVFQGKVGSFTKALYLLVDFTGIPATNIMSQLKAFMRPLYEKADALSTDEVGYSLYEALGDGDYEAVRKEALQKYKSKPNPEEYVDGLLVDALKTYDQRVISGAISYMDGNTTAYESAISALTSDGVPEDLAIKTIQGAATSYKSSVTKAAAAEGKAANAADTAEKTKAEKEKADIIDRLVAMGYDREKIEAAIGSSETEATTETTTSRYSSGMMVSALENGNYASFEKIKSSLLEEKIADYMEKDKSLNQKEAKSKAESSLRSSVTRRYKEEYVNGTETEKKRIREILEKTGLYPKLNKTLNEWEKEAR